MMVRLWIVAAVAVVGVASGGCGDERPISPLVAEPETVGKMADRGGSSSAAEPTAEPTAGGARGWTWGA